MHNAVILLGTNKGKLRLNLERAINFIQDRCGVLIRKSSVYKTEPWGLTDQPYFLNMVIEISTSLSARELLESLLVIETGMGRKRNVKWEPRLIDLDILFYDEDTIMEDGLTIPHPHLHERRFTLEPLAEILPGLLHPVLHKTVRELLACTTDRSEVTIPELSGHSPGKF